MTDAGDDDGDRFSRQVEEPAEGDGDEAGAETWRFDLDEVNDEGIVQTRIEAGDPEPEHVLFVVLGALAMVLVFARLWLLV